jgi:hypothetical protein
MRIIECRFDEDNKEFDLQLQAENQEESSMLVELGNRAKTAVHTYGLVGKTATWLWLHIPLKENSGDGTDFGNQKSIS